MFIAIVCGIRCGFFFNSLPGVHSSITAREQASRSLHSRTLTELRRSETNSQVLKCDKSNRISPSQYPYRCESMTLITASYYTSKICFRSFFFMKGAPVIHQEWNRLAAALSYPEPRICMQH